MQSVSFCKCKFLQSVHQVFAKWLEKFINIWHSSQDQCKTADFKKEREDGCCPLKMGQLEHMKEALHIKDKNSTLSIGLKASKELKLNYKLIDSTNFCMSFNFY